MRILYGVVGEGMGHATRSLVVLDHLLAAGHEVRVVVSGKAHRFLVERLQGRPRVTVDEIHGLTLAYDGDELHLGESLLENLEKAPAGLRRNVEEYRRVAEAGFSPEVVISDFESWAYFYARIHDVPLVSIDNMQVLNRCRHHPSLLGGQPLDFLLARLAVKIKLPGADHYLVTSFFFPPVRKSRTTLVPPILRPEILAAAREPGEHVVVYRSGGTVEEMVPMLQRLGARFVVYGAGREGRAGNVELRAFSAAGFVDDLRTARAVIGGGGFSLMSECVHLGVPMLAEPLRGQFEQELNARYLEHLGYGGFSPELDEASVAAFLERVEIHQEALAGYPRHDNTMTFGCVDELLARLSTGERRPERLASPAMGTG